MIFKALSSRRLGGKALWQSWASPTPCQKVVRMREGERNSGKSGLGIGQQITTFSSNRKSEQDMAWSNRRVGRLSILCMRSVCVRESVLPFY